MVPNPGLLPLLPLFHVFAYDFLYRRDSKATGLGGGRVAKQPSVVMQGGSVLESFWSAGWGSFIALSMRTYCLGSRARETISLVEWIDFSPSDLAALGFFKTKPNTCSVILSLS